MAKDPWTNEIEGDGVVRGSFNFTEAAKGKNAEKLLYLKGNRELAGIDLEEWGKSWNKFVEYRDIAFEAR